MNETIELSRDSLEQILEIYKDATHLLQQIPEMQDQGRLSEVSQHIGAELEARTREMSEIKQQSPTVKLMLEDVENTGETDFENLEQEILGER